MGFFSWKTSDTDRSIRNKWHPRGAFTVYLLDDKGNRYREDHYEGYGVFGGVDFYALLDEMNGGKGDTVAGIELDSLPGQVKRPKLCESPTAKWEDLPDSENCEYQGYFYD